MQLFGIANKNYVPIPVILPSMTWQYAAPVNGISNSNAAVTIRAAQGVGFFNYITGIQLNSTVLSADTIFIIRDGAGTVLWRVNIPAAGISNIRDAQFPMALKTIANSKLEIVTLTAVTGNVYANVQGYTASN